MSIEMTLAYEMGFSSKKRLKKKSPRSIIQHNKSWESGR